MGGATPLRTFTMEKGIVVPSSPSKPHYPVKGIRVVARVLSVLIILFWGFLFIREFTARIGLLPPPPGGLSPLSTTDALQFYSIPIILIGLGLAWKWEVVGSVIALPLAVLVVVLTPTALIPISVIAITAILFLICGWRSRLFREAHNDITLTGSGSVPPANS
jgi:hypothetical protein